MKRKLSGFSLVLCTLLVVLAGCTKDESTHPEPEQIATLNITLPAQTAIRSRGIDDDRENEVNRLDLFIFDNTGNLLPNVGHQTIRSFTQSGNTLNLSIVVTRDGTQQQFYAVANGTDALLSGITTKTQLEALVVTTTSMPQQLFVMTGSSALTTVDSNFNSISLNLTRSVARMDVLLAGSVTNFTIKSARLMQTRSHGYAFQKLDGGSKVTWPGAAVLTDYTTVQIPEAMKFGFTSRLYAYENYNPTANDMGKTTIIVLGGEFNNSGTTTYYRMDIEDNNGDLQILRNNRYEITVTDVQGPGSGSEEDAAISGKANIRFSIDVWRETDVNTEFDGTTSLSVSENNLKLPRDAAGGTILVETSADAWSYDAPIDPGGQPAYWLTVKKDGNACNYMATTNTSGAERVAYFNIKAGTKLKIRVKITQGYGEAMIIKLDATGASVPATGALVVPIPAVFTAMRENVSWTIDPTILTFGDNTQWVDFLGTQVFTGNGDGRIDLIVQPLTQVDVSRSAVVKITATDISTGVTENYKFTVTQLFIQPTLEVDRYYFAAMGSPLTVKLNVKSNAEWTAKIKAENFLATPLFKAFVADEAGTAISSLGDADKTDDSYTATGDDVLYIRFDAVSTTDEIRNGWVVIETVDGSMKKNVRFHQGDYKQIEVNGITILDRNLGALIPGSTNRLTATTDIPNAATWNKTVGYKYQWGRMPDGYEISAGNSATYPSSVNTATLNKMPFSEAFGPATYIYMAGNWSSWFKADASTPEDQRQFEKFWDGNGKADFVPGSSTYTGTLANTNSVGKRTHFDPCPEGWRVPTATELKNIFMGSTPMGDFASNYAKGRFLQKSDGNDTFVSAAGAFSKNGTAAVLQAPRSTIATGTGSIGEEGHYLSSTLSGSANTFYYLFFNNTTVEMRNGPHPTNLVPYMSGGMSVRCMKAQE